MKLIIAIVQDEDAGRLVSLLTEENYRVTKLSTTGGFLRAGNTTLLIGVADEQVNDCLGVVEKVCKSRKQLTPVPMVMGGAAGVYAPCTMEVNVGGATVFVLPVEQFVKF